MLIFIIALIVFFITLWRREYGIATVVLLWPAYLLRTTMAGVPTTALELSIYALTAGWIVSGLKQRQVMWPSLPRYIVVALGLWIMAWILATVFSSDRQASLGALKAWLVDPLLFGLVMLATIRTAPQHTVLLRSVVMSGTFVSMAGLAQLVWFRDTLQDNRLSSFFYPVANYAAMFIGPVLILTVGWILWKQLSRGWWIAVGLMAAALILTVSFGGYFAVGVGALVFWWRWPNRRTKGLAMMAAAIIILLGIFVLSKTPYLAEKFTASDRSSSLVRTQIWRTSWQMIVEHPIVGIGPNAYEPVYRATIPKLYWPPLEWLVSQPHQLYFALWLETGLLGLVVFLGLISLWIKRVWLRVQNGDGSAVTAVAAMLAILAHGLVDTPYFKNDLSVLFVLIFILPFLVSEKNQIEKP